MPRSRAILTVDHVYVRVSPGSLNELLNVLPSLLTS
ncbi:Uncharacterised protein [Mycobacteroides abscessus]|nr:Uncharacterised protein [Mycobacteroides abscessus]